MSSEFEDPEPALQQGSQPTAPTAPHGSPDGPAAPEAPQPLPGAATPDVGQRGGPAAADALLGAQAALTGEPGTLPEVWCRKCEATVKPEGKGRCPRCQTFLRQNFVARRHPVNKLRRQQLLDQFVIDYQPNTQRLQSMCEQFAGIVEQLEVLKPGSPDHQRLVQLSQILGAALEESKPARTTEDYGSMPEPEMVARVTRLLSMLFIARDEPGQDAMLRDLLHLLLRPWASRRQGEMRRTIRQFCDEHEHGLLVAPLQPPDPVDVPVPPARRTPIDDGYTILEPGDVGYTEQEAERASTKAQCTPAPEPRCEYCHQTLTRCAEIKATRLDNWEALHYTDPEEVKKRDDRATAEMLESLRRERTGGIPRW